MMRRLRIQDAGVRCKCSQRSSDLMKRWYLAKPKRAKMTEAERSFADRLRLLNDALCDSHLCPHAEGAYCGCSVIDVFDAYLIYRNGYESCAYRVDYKIGEDGTVTLGSAPVEVLPTMTYPDAPPEPGDMAEALRTDCVPLREAALSEAATANLKLIQPGWGSSGYYGKETLRRAASVFAKGTKMFWNHQTAAEEAARPEGNLDHLAAELTEDASWQDNGPAGPGLYAKAKVFERFASAVKDLKDSIGVSIRAFGKAKTGEAEGRTGPIIEEISSAKSVDFVTVPGAGGQILQLFEAAGRLPVRETNRKETEMTEEQIKALVESAVAPIRTENAALRTDNARLREAMTITSARAFAEVKLKTVALPDVTRSRLVEALSSNPPMKDGALDAAAFATAIEEAAKAEAAYLQAVTGAGQVRGVGAREAAQPKPEETRAELLASFRALGLTETGALAAIEGRAA
jgi:hypothetical protein